MSDSLIKKRTDYLSWDDYFMGLAFLSAYRSKDPSTQVGCVIVSPSKHIVGIGYNGFPTGINDDLLPWARADDNSQLNTKYPYVVHAELNAILNKNSADCTDCVLYTTLFPCNECAKVIIQSKIKKIIYFSDKYKDTTSSIAARRMFDLVKISYEQFKSNVNSIAINFADDNNNDITNTNKL